MRPRKPRAKAESLIYRFAVATTDMAFIGTIPMFSDDPDEQRAINAERRRIERNLTRTRNALLNALTKGECVE